MHRTLRATSVLLGSTLPQGTGSRAPPSVVLSLGFSHNTSPVLPKPLPGRLAPGWHCCPSRFQAQESNTGLLLSPHRHDPEPLSSHRDTSQPAALLVFIANHQNFTSPDDQAPASGLSSILQGTLPGFGFGTSDAPAREKEVSASPKSIPQTFRSPLPWARQWRRRAQDKPGIYV